MHTTRIKMLFFALLALIAFLSLFFVFYSTIDAAVGIQEEQFFTTPIVEVLEGKAKIKEQGSYVYKEIEGNVPIHAGDTIQSSTASRAVVRWANGSTTTIEEKTEIELRDIHPQGAGGTINVIAGEILHDQIPAYSLPHTMLSAGSGAVLDLPFGMAHVAKRAGVQYEVVEDGGILITTTPGEGKIGEELFLFSGQTRSVEERKPKTGTGTLILTKAVTQERTPRITQWMEERKEEKTSLDERYYLLLGQGIAIEETSSLWWLKQIKVREALRTTHGEARTRLLQALLDEAYIRLLIAYREDYSSKEYWKEQMHLYGDMLKKEGQEEAYTERLALYLHTLFARLPGEKEYPVKTFLSDLLLAEDGELYPILPLLFLKEYAVTEGEGQESKEREALLLHWQQHTFPMTAFMDAYIDVLKERTENSRIHYLLEEWKSLPIENTEKSWEEEEKEITTQIEAHTWKNYDELEALRARIRMLPPEKRNLLLEKLEQTRAKTPLPTS